MFHGMLFDGTFSQAGGAFHSLHFFHVRADERLVRNVHPAEFNAEVGRSRLQGQGNGLSRMQRGTGQGGRRADSSLVSTCHAGMLVNELPFGKHEITDFPLNSGKRRHSGVSSRKEEDKGRLKKSRSPSSDVPCTSQQASAFPVRLFSAPGWVPACALSPAFCPSR